MSGQAEQAEGAAGNGWRGSWLRKAMWGAAGLLLLVPVLATRLSTEMNWTAFDFLLVGVLLFGSAGLVDLLMRGSSSLAWRAGAAVALGAAVLTIAANGAVGLIGSEDDPYNFWFLGVIALALVGAAAARLRAQGMAVAMTVAGVAQALAAAFGMSSDMRGGLFSLAFAALWLLSAVLFHKAARDAATRKA